MLETLNAIMALAPLDRKSLTEKALKLSEETGEVARAVLCFTAAHGNTYREAGEEQVLEELADALLVDLSMLAMLPTKNTLAHLEPVLRRKMDKWREKLELQE